MGVGIAAFDVVDVVGGDELEAEFPGPGDEGAIDLGLLVDAVVLQFEVKILGAEGLLEPSMASRALSNWSFMMHSGISLAKQPEKAMRPSLWAASSSLSMRGL